MTLVIDAHILTHHKCIARNSCTPVVALLLYNCFNGCVPPDPANVKSLYRVDLVYS